MLKREQGAAVLIFASPLNTAFHRLHIGSGKKASTSTGNTQSTCTGNTHSTSTGDTHSTSTQASSESRRPMMTRSWECVAPNLIKGD